MSDYTSSSTGYSSSDSTSSRNSRDSSVTSFHKKKRKIRSSRVCLYILFATGIILLVLTVTLGYIVLPRQIGWESPEYLRFLELRDDVKVFLYGDTSVKNKIWLFHYDVVKFNDTKFHSAYHIPFREIGPWIYNKHTKREDIVIGENEATFKESYKYVYQDGLPENFGFAPFFVPMWASFYVMEANPTGQEYLKEGFNAHFRRVIFDSVHKYWLRQGFGASDYMLDGYKYCGDLEKYPKHQKLCRDVLKPAAEKSISTAIDDETLIFSLFGYKQLKDPRTITISIDSDNNYKHLGNILKIDDKETYDVWRDSKCNKLNGAYNFFLSVANAYQDTLKIYVKEFCRPLTFKLSENRTYKNVPFRRYKLTKDNFDFSLPENQCYCNKDLNVRPEEFRAPNDCFLPGVQDLTKCKEQAWVASFPHLLHADKAYFRRTEGFKPNSSSHESYIDISMANGTIISFVLRYQINFLLRKIPLLELLKDQLDILVPLYWVEQTMTLDEDLFEELVKEIIKNKQKVPRMLDILATFFLVLSLIIIIICIVWFVILVKNKCCGRSKKDYDDDSL